MKRKLLIVEDDTTFLTMLTSWLARKGFETESASTVSAATKMIDNGRSFDLVLSDMRLPDGSGLDVLDRLRAKSSTTPLVIMTSYAEVQNAVNAMKHGARDYIAKPFQPAVLLEKINEAIGPEAIATSVDTKAKAPAKTVESADRFIEGESDMSRRLFHMVGIVAPTPMSVLITGANGTGKEYVANRIHQLSKRAAGPFVAIDCGALTKDLSASEFFGHVKGSFTGALADKQGAFAEANGGTLFLDEVGNLSYDIQVQLLRALQERRVRPVGSTREIPVDVRLVCATNADLPRAIAEGKFREDLYHRINEFNITMPSLHERGNDVLLYARHFLAIANDELDRHITGFTPEACRLILDYTWPGNLRQLNNCIKRATLLATGNAIDATDLDIPPATSPVTRPLHDNDRERQCIIDAIRAAGGNKALAARNLGIDRKTLYNKIRFYNISTV